MKDLDLKNFPSISKSDWLELAENQLKGADPTKTLGWGTDQLENLLPYYDQSDLEDAKNLQPFFQSLEPIEWKLYEEIEVINEKEANAQALEALAGGCNGIVFSFSKKPKLETLLQGILTDICEISLLGDVEIAIEQSKVKGFSLLRNFSNTYDVLTSTESQVDQIASILKNLTTETHILRSAAADFFLEVSTVRALRYLLHDTLGKDPKSVSIHTCIPLHQQKQNQWFLNSTAGLASILGGTNSVRFSTADGNPRISRNVGNLIREESGIVQYTDQCGGSYFVESLTYKIIQACRAKINQ